MNTLEKDAKSISVSSNPWARRALMGVVAAGVLGLAACSGHGGYGHGHGYYRDGYHHGGYHKDRYDRHDRYDRSGYRDRDRRDGRGYWRRH